MRNEQTLLQLTWKCIKFLVSKNYGKFHFLPELGFFYFLLLIGPLDGGFLGDDALGVYLGFPVFIFIWACMSIDTLGGEMAKDGIHLAEGNADGTKNLGKTFWSWCIANLVLIIVVHSVVIFMFEYHSPSAAEEESPYSFTSPSTLRSTSSVKLSDILSPEEIQEIQGKVGVPSK